MRPRPIGAGTGRIIDGDAMEEMQAEVMANQIVDQHETALNILMHQGKMIQTVQVFDNIGWQKRAVLIRFSDGTSLRIVGEHIQIEES